jgi:hypothetical protein
VRHIAAAAAVGIALILTWGPTSSADPDTDSGGVTAPANETTPPRPTDARPSPPPNDVLIQPFPVIVPTATAWEPLFPFPYDQTRRYVTDADLTAEREACQWFNAQYDTLITQIDRVQFNRIDQYGPGVRVGSGTDWDYSHDGIQQQVDIVTANIAQSRDFLTPRVLAFTQRQDFAGDNYFPLYQADNFFLMWQHLSNTLNGIEAHQPDWFTGPSVLGIKRAGSKINRSHVCR